MVPPRTPPLSEDRLGELIPELTNLSRRYEGGQKQVFYAELEGVPVAVKVLLPERPVYPDVDPYASTLAMDDEDEGSSDDTDAIDPRIPGRLRREIDLLSRINSPNVVRMASLPNTRGHIRSLVDDTTGVTYFAYAEEWIGGKNLDEITNKGQEKLPLKDVVALGRNILSAIEELDRLGVVHRDIKPLNIMRRDDGVWLLVDFGLAFEVNGEGLTASGTWLGTAAWTAPEVNNPELKDRLDYRADVFSLGLVLYEALSAQHAYEGRKAGRTVDEAIRAMNTVTATAISELVDGIPDDLAAMIMRMIERDLDLRVRRLGQVCGVLDRCWGNLQ